MPNFNNLFKNKIIMAQYIYDEHIKIKNINYIL